MKNLFAIAMRNVMNMSLDQMVSNVSKFNFPVEANKSYEDTNFHQLFVTNAESVNFQFDENDDRPERIVKTVITAWATYLSKRKVAKPDEATALILHDIAGNFKFAGIVEYFANSNPDEPGNWTYTMTFNEEDVKDLEQRKKLHTFIAGDDAFRSIVDKAAYDVGGMKFNRETYIFDACHLVFDTILSCLDYEAKEGQTVDIELPGYFIASVAVENGEKIKSITPDEHMKALIKSDINLEA